MTTDEKYYDVEYRMWLYPGEREGIKEQEAIEKKRQEEEAKKRYVTIKYQKRQEKGFGTPWIGRVHCWVKGQQECDWGSYSSLVGALKVEAFPGDIIRYGQKNYNGQSDSHYAVVVNDKLEIREISSGEAWRIWNERMERECGADSSDK